MGSRKILQRCPSTVNVEEINLRRIRYVIVEDLLRLIQNDPTLWEILEQLKHQDESPEDFLLSVAQMLSIEFEELHRTDLSDKLAALFGGLPEKAFVMVPLLLHIALDIFLMRAIPNREAIRN